MQLLTVVASILFSARGQMLREDGPSKQFQRSAAFYGINFMRASQLRTFDAYWSQIIAVTLPSV